MSDTLSPVSAPVSDPKAGAKIIFVGAILILVAIAFVLVNIRPQGSGTFAVTTDKASARYYDFEMPIFRVTGARPGSRVTAVLMRDGKKIAQTASGVTIDAQGQGFVRGAMITDENSPQYKGDWTVMVRGDAGEQAEVRYSVMPGCVDQALPKITTDKQEYKVGEEIRYTVQGPKDTQVRWFGLSGRADNALDLGESNAYYGDVTDTGGQWKSTGLIASLPDQNAQEGISTALVTLCDKTAQAKVTVRR